MTYKSFSTVLTIPYSIILSGFMSVYNYYTQV